jgi:hypothetical protein
MQSPSIDRLQERFGILQARYGYQLLDAESYGEFAKACRQYADPVCR